MAGKPVFSKIYCYKGGKDVDLEKLRKMPSLPVSKSMDNCFFYGEFEIIGNMPLKANEFGDMWMSHGKSINAKDANTVYLQWGMIYCETTIDLFGKYTHNKYRNEGIGYGLEFLGSKEIDRCIKAKSNAPYWEVKTHGRFDDLRNPKNEAIRNEILEFFGLNPKLSYGENFKIWSKNKNRDYLKGHML